jgi:hypothetical protein
LGVNPSQSALEAERLKVVQIQEFRLEVEKGKKAVVAQY